MDYTLETLTEQYQILHQTPTKFTGEFVVPHLEKIGNLISSQNVSSILDYGSGKGDQYLVHKYHEVYFNNILPVLYDPGVPKFNKLPFDKFDLVICTDVLEHIPESLIPQILSEIYDRATKCVFLAICNTEQTESKFTNGQHIHLTCKRGPWWVNKIRPFATVLTVLNVYGFLGNMTTSFNSRGLLDIPTYS